MAAACQHVGLHDYVLIDEFSRGAPLRQYPDVYWHSKASDLRLDFHIYDSAALDDPVTSGSYRGYLRRCTTFLPSTALIDDRVAVVSRSSSGEYVLRLQNNDETIEVSHLVLATGNRSHPKIASTIGSKPKFQTTWSTAWTGERIAVIGSGALAWDAAYYLAKQNRVFWFQDGAKVGSPFFVLRPFFEQLHSEIRANLTTLPSSRIAFHEDGSIWCANALKIPNITKVILCCGYEPEWPSFLSALGSASSKRFACDAIGATPLSRIWAVGSLRYSTHSLHEERFVSKGHREDRIELARVILEDVKLSQ